MNSDETKPLLPGANEATIAPPSVEQPPPYEEPTAPGTVPT